MELKEDQAQEILKANLQVPKWVIEAREQSDKLFALMHGDNFIDQLITQIEYIESKKKAEARAKYSRNIVPYFTRILRPVANVYSANGGSMSFDIKDRKDKEKLLKKLSRARSGKSLRDWLKTFWMPLYHSDPNGVIFLEYETEPESNCWPTYKQISHIRSYRSKGQLLEWIMFEPRKVLIDNKPEIIVRLVDDTMDRTYLQKGDNFTLLDSIGDKKVTFEHPFGQVPALINSDIEKFRGDIRLSPVDSIIEMSEEYARDQSVKTLYKKYMGFPKEWKYVDQCKTCFGVKKDTEGEVCQSCNGHGYYEVNDVTDILTLAIPEGDEVKITPDVAGFVVPPLDIWTQYNEELKTLDEVTHATHWGTLAGFTSQVQKTATEVFFDTQPMTDKLNDYADVAEMMESQLIEWIANLLIPSKKKDDKIAFVNYGRRYIIDSADVILEKYEKAKREGDNNVILDRLFNEYLTARYRRDPEFLRTTLIKSVIEPYLHLSVDQVDATFGKIEAQRKVLFKDWWETLTPEDKGKSQDDLALDFNKWFDNQQPEGEEKDADTLSNQAKLRGSVGGVTGIVNIIAAVSQNQMTAGQAISVLKEIYGLTEEAAKAIIGDAIIPTEPNEGGGE
jgi:hypothetical protein